jgi:hypothetical protein
MQPNGHQRLRPLPKRESKSVDFKEQMDVSRPADWCELLKDIVAIANSGGGTIVVGLKNDGSPSDWDPAPLLSLDHAKLVDRIAKYTGEQFADIEITEQKKDGKRMAALEIGGSRIPMVFVNPGTYEVPTSDGRMRQETAFGRGTLYFRHGAKSEPARPEDLRAAVDRIIAAARRELLSNVRKLAHVPAGQQVRFVAARIADASDSAATPFRLTNDPEAQAVRGLDPNKTHPYRASEVVKHLNGKLKGRKSINSYDVLAVRRLYRIAADEKPEFVYAPRFGAPQYSEAFIDWMVTEYEKNARFFDRTRSSCRRMGLT